MHCIKPPSCLINSFSNKIRRKIIFKKFFVFKWIMVLCIWHRTRLKPAVKYLRRALVGLSILFNEDLVDMVFMQIINLDTGKLFQLLDG